MLLRPGSGAGHMAGKINKHMRVCIEWGSPLHAAECLYKYIRKARV